MLWSRTYQFPDRIYAVECEVQEFWTMNATDERWSYTDKAGHVHRYERGEDHYPTLAEKSRTVTNYFDGDEYESVETWMVCRECGEVIEPGTTEGMLHIPGPTAYRIDHEFVSKDHFDRRLAEDKARHGVV
jgi:hypothetical protein